jgi:hypothetical protein
MWGAIGVTFEIAKHVNTANRFGSWLKSFTRKQRSQVLIGVAALCWALWLNSNEVVFQRSKSKSILQVLFRGTYWIRSWSILSKEEEVNNLKEGCRQLQTAALDFINRAGWNVLRRIKF